jgi:hypothetical protein
MRDGHVALPEVHARRADGERDVDAVVDDERDRVFVKYGFGERCEVDELEEEEEE